MILPPRNLSGGKRANIRRDAGSSNFEGYGKDESCVFEGPWKHLVILAAKILRHPATEVVAPNLHRPDLKLTPEQEDNYTSLNDPPGWCEDELTGATKRGVEP